MFPDCAVGCSPASHKAIASWLTAVWLWHGTRAGFGQKLTSECRCACVAFAVSSRRSKDKSTVCFEIRSSARQSRSAFKLNFALVSRTSDRLSQIGG